jgi:nitrite reductase (NADH) large subunit
MTGGGQTATETRNERDVVVDGRARIDDSLGLHVTLDAPMAWPLASYPDQWRDTLDNPGWMARVTAFIHAPNVPDPSISFEMGRGRQVPAPGDPGPVPLGLPTTREVPR